MINNQRPTFGASKSQQQDSKRQESGAVWKRQAKKDNTEFLSIKINLSKDRLKELLNKEGETIDIGFVAFPNPYKSEGAKRPDFRVFEDRDVNE